MRQKYKLLYRGPFPSVTPHVLRHTFCTNMQQAGLDPKSLQYVMGHSDLELTLSLYTHSDYVMILLNIHFVKLSAVKVFRFNSLRRNLRILLVEMRRFM